MVARAAADRSAARRAPAGPAHPSARRRRWTWAVRLVDGGARVARDACSIRCRSIARRQRPSCRGGSRSVKERGCRMRTRRSTTCSCSGRSTTCSTAVDRVAVLQRGGAGRASGGNRGRRGDFPVGVDVQRLQGRDDHRRTLPGDRRRAICKPARIATPIARRDGSRPRSSTRRRSSQRRCGKPGLEDVRVVGVEGPAWLWGDRGAEPDDAEWRDAALWAAREVESDPEFMPVSAHLLGIAHR